MWLIAEIPVTVRTAQGEVKLVPGIPHELSDPVGARVLHCAGDRVHVYAPEAGKPDWLTAWREVAAISSGLTQDEPRLPVIMAALGVCDAAFEADDWAGFQEAKAGVSYAMKRRGLNDAARS